MIKVIPFSNFFAVIFLQQFGYPEIRITETYDIHFTRSSDAEIQQNSAELRSVSAYTTAWEMALPIIQRIPSMKAERATSSIKLYSSNFTATVGTADRSSEFVATVGCCPVQCILLHSWARITVAHWSGGKSRNS